MFTLKVIFVSRNAEIRVERNNWKSLFKGNLLRIIRKQLYYSLSISIDVMADSVFRLINSLRVSNRIVKQKHEWNSKFWENEKCCGTTCGR